jgi:ATP-dependent DNA helicase RecG
VELETPLSRVVGRVHAKLARELDLHTVGELLFHFPRRYEEKGRYTDVGTLAVGEQVTVQARVLSSAMRPMRTRAGQIAEVVVGDDSGGRLTLTFFGRTAYKVAKELTPGRWGLFAGQVSQFKRARQLTHPDYHLIDQPGGTQVGEYLSALIPIYPATTKLKVWEIQKAVRAALGVVVVPPDPVPASLRGRLGLTDLATALRDVHEAPSGAAVAAARHRLKWDEAFAVQLTLGQRRRRSRAVPAIARPRRPGGLVDAFDSALPYQLTTGQRSVGEQLARELARPHPMHRLLQGEVGSGKTVCAVRAALQVVDAGGQAAVLAPTEVLAAQHHRSLTELLGPLGRAGELGGDPDGTQLALVTGSQGAAARRWALDAAASGAAGIVVGTHALLYEGVDFHDLGLVVIDEQHRFGVEQRDALRAKAGQPPHVLVMTATPIPRTVAMTVYGDLDVSTLRELPLGRSPIATHVVPAAERPALFARAWQRVREEVAAGHQVYVVCARIGDEEAEPPAEVGDERRPPVAVLEVASSLAAGELSGLRLGVLHGRLPGDQKDAVMRSFAAGSVDVLVSTTVVEVGVDVANATMMVVLDADRFGVSQLHQLRGRVGRGSAPGLCLLVTDAPAGSEPRERLDAVASTVDGFRLAELDLEQRREGDVLGAAQSGRRSHLRLLSLLRDAELIGEARAEAEALLDLDPDLEGHPELASMVAALVDAERAEFLQKA